MNSLYFFKFQEASEGVHRVVNGSSQVLRTRRVEASHADAAILSHINVVLFRHVLYLHHNDNTVLETEVVRRGALGAVNDTTGVEYC